MKSANDRLHDLTGRISRFFEGFGKKETEDVPEVSPQQKVDLHEDTMLRVTDMAGNEYLCPTNVLKDRNFVSESETGKCFDYNLISRSNLD